MSTVKCTCPDCLDKNMPKPKQLLIFPKESKELKIQVNQDASIEEVYEAAKHHLNATAYRSISFKYRNSYIVIAKLKEKEV